MIKIQNSLADVYFQNALVANIRSTHATVTHRTIQQLTPDAINYLRKTIDVLSKRSDDTGLICKKIGSISTAILDYKEPQVAIPPLDALSIGWFTATTLLADKSKNVVLSTHTTGLSRILHYCPQRELLFVLTPPEQSSTSAQGTFKTVMPGVEIALNSPQSINTTTYKTRKIAHAITKKELKPYELNLVRQELRIQEQLISIKGVLRVISHALFSDKSSTQFSIIYDWYDHTLFSAQRSRLINCKQQLQMALDLTQALAAMHKAGTIHGDLKTANMLCTISNTTKADAVICDLNSSFKPNEEIPNYIIGWGYYGSLWYTPPELFGDTQTKWQLDQYIKMEIWALGICFYQLFLGKTPSWSQLIHNEYRTNFDSKTVKHISALVLNNARKSVNQKIQTTVEDELQQPHLIDNKCMHIVYQMLRAQPDQRISLAEVSTQLSKLLEQVNQSPTAAEAKLKPSLTSCTIQ